MPKLLSLFLSIFILSNQRSVVSSDGGPSPPGLYNSAGQILNIDYANNAVASGSSTEVAVCNGNFSVLMSYSRKPSFEKSVNSHHHSIILGEKSYIRRHRQLSTYIGLAHIGLVPDCVHLSEKLFEETSEYQYVYNSEISGQRLITSIANYIHEHTLYPSSLRPFGVNLCMINYDDIHGPQIYEVDCFGNVHNRQLTCLGPLSKEFIKALNEEFSSGQHSVDNCSILFSPIDAKEEGTSSESSQQQPPLSTAYSSSPLQRLKQLPISKLIEQVLSVVLTVERDVEAEEEDDNSDKFIHRTKTTTRKNIHTSSSPALSSRINMNTKHNKRLTKDLLSQFRSSGNEVEISIVGKGLPFTTIDQDLIDYALTGDDDGEFADFSIIDEYIEQLIIQSSQNNNDNNSEVLT